MDDRQDREEKQITLEALLKTKRFEKPTAEFWEKFDRELQQKTLQSLVKRDSWWKRLCRGTRDQVRPALPLTAAAALLMVLFTSQEMTFFSSETTGGSTVEAFQTVSASNETIVDTSVVTEASAPQIFADSIEGSDREQYVVGAFSAVQSENRHYTQLPVSKSMSASGRGVVYVAGRLSSTVASLNPHNTKSFY